MTITVGSSSGSDLSPVPETLQDWKESRLRRSPGLKKKPTTRIITKATRAAQKKEQLPPRKLLYIQNLLNKYDLDHILGSDLKELKDCATLAMKDHFIRKSLDWNGWRVTKIEEAFWRWCNGYKYQMTFQAEKAKPKQKMRFEAHVWSAAIHRQVTSVRTLSPKKTEWEIGNLWIPVTY